MNRSRNQSRTFATILLLCLAVFLVFAFVYEWAEAGHDCHGHHHDCEICLCLECIVHTIQQLIAVGIVCLFLFFTTHTPLLSADRQFLCLLSLSPITLKVKLIH